MINPTPHQYRLATYIVAHDADISQETAALQVIDHAVDLYRRVANLDTYSKEVDNLEVRYGLHIEFDSMFGVAATLARFEAESEWLTDVAYRDFHDAMRRQIKALRKRVNEIKRSFDPTSADSLDRLSDRLRAYREALQRGEKDVPPPELSLRDIP